MPGNPDKCECGSQLFTAVWAVTAQGDTPDSDLNPKEGNTAKRPVGFECVECGDLQLTREVPQDHADASDLDLPQNGAARDMVRE